jgi:hypothetical protein
VATTAAEAPADELRKVRELEQERESGFSNACAKSKQMNF